MIAGVGVPSTRFLLVSYHTTAWLDLKSTTPSAPTRIGAVLPVVSPPRPPIWRPDPLEVDRVQSEYSLILAGRRPSNSS
jgi:hypothetical protein